jgi:uncharacterized repeat protein (TIGR01451 family)
MDACRRTTALGIGVAALLLLRAAPAAAQPPPPAPFPLPDLPAETVEPPLADPKTGEARPTAVVPGIQQVGATVPAAPPAAPRAVGPLPPAGMRAADPPTPVVTLHVGAPATVAVGQDVEYRLVVENRSRANASVTVRSPLPENTTFVRAEPEPASREKELRWPLGPLPPGGRKEIRVTVKPAGAMAVDCRAFLLVEYGQVVTTRVVKPTLSVRHLPPPGEAVRTEGLPLKLEVVNTGEVPAADVVLTDSLLTEGFEFEDGPAAEGAAAGERNHRRWALGTLPPGAKRVVACSVRAGKTGKVETRAEVTAGGGATAVDGWTGTVHEAQLSLDVLGQKDGFTGNLVQYQIEVRNTGTATLRNVVLNDALPAHSELAKATAGGEIFQNQHVQWIFPTLAPNEAKQVSVSLRSTVPGLGVHEVTATADRGLRQQKSFGTDFQATASLQVRLTRPPGQVELGQAATYTVSVHNTGSGPVQGVRVAALVPEQLAVTTTAPSNVQREGPRLAFAPLTVAAGQTATFTVTAQARQPGDLRFRIEVSAEGLGSGPITREEVTTVLPTAAPSPAPPPGIPLPTKPPELPPPPPGGRPAMPTQDNIPPPSVPPG